MGCQETHGISGQFTGCQDSVPNIETTYRTMYRLSVQWDVHTTYKTSEQLRDIGMLQLCKKTVPPLLYSTRNNLGRRSWDPSDAAVLREFTSDVMSGLRMSPHRLYTELHRENFHQLLKTSARKNTVNPVRGGLKFVGKFVKFPQNLSLWSLKRSQNF